MNMYFIIYNAHFKIEIGPKLHDLTIRTDWTVFVCVYIYVYLRVYECIYIYLFIYICVCVFK